MTCSISDVAAAAAWPALSELSQRLRDDPLSASARCHFVRRAGEWSLEEAPESGDALLAVPLGEGEGEEAQSGFNESSTFLFRKYLRGDDCWAHHHRPVAEADLALFRLYLPMILGAWRARLRGRSFVTAHIAQTLDGRIACLNGHSQWISNEANLHHSHRLRALHDGVLVGRKTVESDDPKLTVRHVRGHDPVRVVLSGSGSVLRNPGNYQVLQGAGSLVLCERTLTADLPEFPDEVRVLKLESEQAEGGLGVDTICEALKERNLNSLFVEGGGQTLSSFLAAGRTDILHVHIAPRILGSGVSAFEFPPVTRIQDGRALHMEHFNLDGELLLECRTLEALGTHE